MQFVAFAATVPTGSLDIWVGLFVHTEVCVVVSLLASGY